jgi:aconitase B
MCEQGHVLTFTSNDCKIRREDSGKLVTTTSKTHSNIYILDEVKKEKCCLGREDESWL